MDVWVPQAIPGLRATAGLLPSAARTASIYFSICNDYCAAVRSTVLTVFSCVASRNKRGVSHSQMAGSTLRRPLPHPQIGPTQPQRNVISLRPAGAPTGRFIGVFFAILAGHRPRRAVPSCWGRGGQLGVRHAPPARRKGSTLKPTARRRLKREIVKMCRHV